MISSKRIMEIQEDYINNIDQERWKELEKCIDRTLILDYNIQKHNVAHICISLLSRIGIMAKNLENKILPKLKLIYYDWDIELCRYKSWFTRNFIDNSLWLRFTPKTEGQNYDNSSSPFKKVS